METILQYIVVPGYGAARYPTEDGNNVRYLGEVRQYIELHPHIQFVVYLCGGYTNRKDLSEAKAMWMWFKKHGVPKNAELLLIDSTMTAWENLAAAEKEIGDQPVIVFCEWTRRFYMEFYTGVLFPRYTLMPVPFDAYSLEWRNRIRTYLKTPLYILAYYSPLVDRLIKQPLREHHVARARKKFDAGL